LTVKSLNYPGSLNDKEEQLFGA